MMTWLRKPAQRRYLFVFWPLMILYVLLVVLISWVTPISGLPDGPRHVLALTPVLPIAGVVWAMGRRIAEEPDELARLIQVRAILAATGLLLVFGTGWGFLQEYTDLPPYPVIILFPTWCGFFGLATVWAGRRYR